ncbi:hypothetical protein F4808DRAFT_266811 [Astrocystis sublimbata]|nr:hypothetical protein F4808DRAFT_266811 [Astrocystis sublimbata]
MSIMRSIFITSLLLGSVASMPIIAKQQVVSRVVESRDGTTEFDPDFFLKVKRDGTTEFDPDFFLKGKRDGTTEFDPDFFLKH